MKTVSIVEFSALTARSDWSREQDQEVVERLTHRDEQWNEKNQCFDVIHVPHAWGWASLTSTLAGIRIKYTESFNYNEGDPDSLAVGTEGQDKVWLIEGVTVLDDDGDKMDAIELAEYLDAAFAKIDYSVLGIE